MAKHPAWPGVTTAVRRPQRRRACPCRTNLKGSAVDTNRMIRVHWANEMLGCWFDAIITAHLEIARPSSIDLPR